jgi:2-keto-4-pentenoate hydratase/2-oxohepta-3-ene-1,7-dioic acid hydratase in catechol pathway
LKFLTFQKGNKLALGVKTEAGVIDIERALSNKPSSNVPTDIMEIISSGDQAVNAIRGYIAELETFGDETYMLDVEGLPLGPCVTRPNKIICVGLNYRKHAEETNSPYPTYPILFNKFNNTLTGHLQNIAVPKVTEKLDYEVELCIVIGKQAKYVTSEQGLGHVFGYCVVNDLSARDLQLRTPQWLLGKSCDGFSPLGPYLVTADEVENPNQLHLRTTVNGEVRQNSNTSDMIFPCNEIVSYISQYMTLEPGDIILTGTPEGVVMGNPPEKQIYLQPGDEVTVEIEKLGSLTNRMVSEEI